MAAISTGSLSLDLALGVGGVPRGRIVEIFGPESSGKTTLCYHILAEAQKAGGTCAFIDAEHSMDPAYAAAIGVDVDELLVSQPDSGEQALEICELLVRSGAIDIVCIDSVAALVPKAELEGEIGDSFVGIQARLMSQALRKLAGSLNRSGTVCVFTNQLREKIGVMFGSPETTPGGRALKFYASVRLDIRRIETLKDGAEAYGNRVRVKVVKNKVAPPFRQAEFDVIYGHGISWEGTVLDVGLEKGVVQKSGSFLSFEEERIGQGREKAKAFLREHPDVLQRMLNRIQAVSEGSIIPGATVPPPGLALGEVVAEAPPVPEPGGARPTASRSRPAPATPEPAAEARRRRDGRRARAGARRGRQGAGAPGALARGARGAARAASRRPRSAQAVVDDLERLGYVDDEALALALAEQRLASGWGPGRVEADLERLAWARPRRGPGCAPPRPARRQRRARCSPRAPRPGARRRSGSGCWRGAASAPRPPRACSACSTTDRASGRRAARSRGCGGRPASDEHQRRQQRCAHGRDDRVGRDVAVAVGQHARRQRARPRTPSPRSPRARR